MDDDKPLESKPYVITAGGVVEPDVPFKPSFSGGGGKGCFIATAAYGSYLAPEVKKFAISAMKVS